MKKRIVSLLLILCMTLTLLPTTILAAETAEPLATGSEEQQPEELETPSAGKTIYVDATNGDDTQAGVGTTSEKAYKTLATAVAAAESGDTIMLSEGKFSTYGNNSPQKSLTFIGAENGKTEWYIGSPTPDEAKEGTEYNGDYSFDGCENVTFKNIKFSVYSSNYKGFIRIDNVVIDGCEISGQSTYWGFKTTTFKNTVFNCPNEDYALWYYTGNEMSFDNCTFNASGKIINAYREATVGTLEKPLVLNVKDCTVISSAPDKSVLNIKDHNNHYIVNISGTNVITGLEPDEHTCSRLFQVEGWADDYNLSGGKSNEKSCQATVKIDDTTVWQNGKMVSHAIDTANDKYTDGYKDDAFTVTWGAWTAGQDGKLHRTGTCTCNYCGYSEDINDEKDFELDVSRSKTATDLDSNYRSTVTLSLPSAKEKLASDIVFVIDKSQCGKKAAEAAQQLVENLLAQQALTNAKINVGIVIFGGTAFVSRPLSEVTSADDLKAAMSEAAKTGLHGSNVQSGLIEADKMLAEDTEVSNSRKYMILISDGHTYQFSKEGEYEAYTEDGVSFNGLKTYGIYNETDLYAYAYGITYTIHGLHDQYYTGDYNADGTYKGGWSGSYLTNNAYKTGKYGNSDEVGNAYEMPYGTWNEYLKHITTVVARDDGQYDVALTHENGDYDNQCIGNSASIPRDERAATADKILGTDHYIECGLDKKDNDNQLMHASGVDRAVFEAYTKYASMAEKYNCYPIFVSKDYWDSAKTAQDYGYQLIHAMGEISHSTGTDISKGNDPVTIPNVENIFASIENDILYAVGAGSTVVDKMGSEFDFVPGSLKLTVGGKELDAKTVGDVTYFGDDATNLSESNCRFKVEYNSREDLFTWTINENVSNFAPVQLSYQVQLDNPKTAPGTYTVPTNEYAKLTPKDSLGHPGKELPFPIPKVSYTVSPPYIPAPTPSKPALNTDDHYAYVMGYPDGTVQPGGYITRAEASTIFFRLLTDETREQYWATTNAYSDIKSGDWYNNAISTLSNAGIVSGYPDGTFRPNAPITRAEMSKIIALFAKLDKTTDRFSDIAGHWAEAYIKLAAGNGWIEGYPDGTFKPQQNITRAETVTMINRVLERVPSDEDHLLSEHVMLTFPDCKSGDWFYIAVQEATNSHTYEHAVTEKNGDEQWTALRANRDWTLLEK